MFTPVFAMLSDCDIQSFPSKMCIRDSYYGEEVGLSGLNNYPYQTNRYDMDFSKATKDNVTYSAPSMLRYTPLHIARVPHPFC